MARAAITKRAVDSAQPNVTDTFLWDAEVAGFGLKVTPAGGKTYVFQYRIARSGQAERTPPKRYTIGKHGRITPDQARRRAKELGALVEQGIDPRQRELEAALAEDLAERALKERERVERELGFCTYATAWLSHYEDEQKRRPSGVKLAKFVVEKHLKPALHDKPLPYISRTDIQPIIDAIPLQHRGMRRAVFAYASVLFGWASKRGDIPRNPLTDIIKPAAPESRDRVLSDPELVQIWEASHIIDARFGAFFRLLILTGQRRNEVVGMNWTELDRAAATWTIPAARAKNRMSHIVPLSAMAVVELNNLVAAHEADVEARADGAWPQSGAVLTTRRGVPISGFSKAKKALDEAVRDRVAYAATADPVRQRGVQMAPWRVHDLRRTLATGFQKLGVRFEVTEATLNHVSGAKGGVAGIYQRHDWKEEKRAALDAWARHVASILRVSSEA